MLDAHLIVPSLQDAVADRTTLERKASQAEATARALREKLDLCDAASPGTTETGKQEVSPAQGPGKWTGHLLLLKASNTQTPAQHTQSRRATDHLSLGLGT